MGQCSETSAMTSIYKFCYKSSVYTVRKVYYYYYYYINALLYVLYHLSSLSFLFVVSVLFLRPCAVSAIDLIAVVLQN